MEKINQDIGRMIKRSKNKYEDNNLKFKIARTVIKKLIDSI
jgi:hypothetical protein